MCTAALVEPRADISVAVLPAGIEVEFDLVRISPTVDWVWVRRKTQVAIDGEVVLAERLIAEADSRSVAIVLEP